MQEDTSGENSVFGKAKIVYDHFHTAKIFNDNLSELRRELYREVKDVMQKDVLKDTNNKIKVLKRKMYGFRDFEFFKLKIFDLYITILR